MPTFSFDIVSDYDKAEMNNVFAQVEKEINNRYDFKGSPAAIEWLADKKGFKLTGENQWQVEAVLEIVRKKLTTRNQTIKSLDLTKTPIESNLRTAWEIPFVAGLSQDNAKKITSLLRESVPKVKAQIQGEAVRVTSGSKDDLQAAIKAVDAADFEFPTQYINYR